MQARLLVVAALLLPSIALSAQSHLVRLGDADAGRVGRIATAALGDERVIAAVEDEGGDLKLIVWDVTADGKFTRRDSIGAGTTSLFALTAVGTSSAVTALRMENGNLRLVDWAINANGKITRKGQINAGAVDRIDVVAAGASRVVTATVNDGHTKLIAWDLSAAGEFTRRGDRNASDGTRAAVAALSASQLVLAVKDAGGKLDVSSWSLNQAGDLAPLQSGKGKTVTEIDITNTALDRAVTACGLPDGTVEVQAWDVDGVGKVTAGSSAKAGTADNIALDALGSAKVVTALRQADQSLKVITWRVVDTVVRLDSIEAGAVGRVAVATLGWDRIITAVQAANKDLKLIDFADFSVALLNGQWGPTPPSSSMRVAPIPTGVAELSSAIDPDDDRLMNTSRSAPSARLRRIDTATEVAETAIAVRVMPPPPGPPGPPSPTQSPAPALVFFPNISGVDPMIAVGKDFVIVSEDHTIEFLYKTGPKAGQQLDSKAGEQTLLSSKAFFNAFFAPTDGGGKVNRNNVNLHMRTPPSFDPVVVCMPASATPAAPCMNEAYDTRVIYDPYRSRFVVMSHIRGTGLSGPTIPVARRYVAIAVSHGEDPRDGFYQYMTTESNYSDWPRIASNDGLLVVAHNACKSPDAVDTCGSDHPNFPGNAMALRPMAYVYRIDDMIQHQHSPRNWKIYPYQVDGGTFYPVAHHGSSSGWTYLVKPTSGLDVYGFKQPLNTWDKIPTLAKSSFVLDGGASGFREAVHFQNGKLYMGSAVSVADRVPNVSPERWHVRAVRIPVALTGGGGIKAGPCPATAGCLDVHFGLHALEDKPADVLSYEMASLVPNKDGDMVMVYGRVPVKMNTPIGQEARYSVIYDDERGLQRSRLIQGGGPVLKDIYCKSGQSETTAVAVNYFHVWYGDDVCASQNRYQDYGTAAIDPDGKTFWVVHSYASSTSFKMVGAKVVP